MKEAMFYEPLTQGRVLCTLCALYCKIAPGRRGACGVRLNVDDKLYTLVYDRVVGRHVDPIEKKPFFHFLPGSRTYSIATVGCNFRCLHCQNYEISQQPKAKTPPLLARPGDPDVLCLALHATGNVTPLAVWMAWAYAALRAVHSVVHLTYNDVRHRGLAFAASNVVLAAMWIGFLTRL